ncbi:hypothetical protein H4R20_006563, partial [Coemansia guatemalensis]
HQAAASSSSIDERGEQSGKTGFAITAAGAAQAKEPRLGAKGQESGRRPTTRSADQQVYQIETHWAVAAVCQKQSGKGEAPVTACTKKESIAGGTSEHGARHSRMHKGCAAMHKHLEFPFATTDYTACRSRPAGSGDSSGSL